MRKSEYFHCRTFMRAADEKLIINKLGPYHYGFLDTLILYCMQGSKLSTECWDGEEVWGEEAERKVGVLHLKPLLTYCNIKYEELGMGMHYISCKSLFQLMCGDWEWVCTTIATVLDIYLRFCIFTINTPHFLSCYSPSSVYVSLQEPHEGPICPNHLLESQNQP